jgi:hypothetical protein
MDCPVYRFVSSIKKNCRTGSITQSKNFKNMKKVTTILTAIVLLFSATAFAAKGDTVTDQVKGAFEKDFVKAKNVTWQKNGDFYFASFVMNDMMVNAAYDDNGELVGTSRKIALAQVPLSVSLALTEKYSQYTIPDQVTELTYDGETKYQVFVSDEKKTIQLKIRSNGDITVEKKIKKK